MTREPKRTAWIATVIVAVLLGVVVADFRNNGVIDNGKFLIVGLFIFSGTVSGNMADRLLDRYLGGRKDEDKQD